MRTRDVQNHLRAIGFDNVSADGSYGPVTRQAVRNFQAGFAFWNLAVDGQAGPATWAALRHSVARGGAASAHFKFAEFRCKCKQRNGRAYSTCQRILLSRELVRDLEVYRSRYGATGIVSGYRCPSYNRQIGGASASRHMYGDAADVSPRIHWTRVANLRIFGGIGKVRSTGLVRHVDERPVSPATPTVWNY